MKIIDLLKKIANGEEAPNRVRFDNVIWNKVRGEKNIFYIDEYDNDLFIHFFRKNLDFTLNDEIEILEEEKKIPEKLDYCEENTFMEQKETTYLSPKERRLLDSNFKELGNKINSIIDYLKSKGDE